MNLAKYEFAKTPSDWEFCWNMDARHVSALYELALRCTGNVVEIGCFRGYSTAAFVEALNDGADFQLHLVDVKITDELRRVVSMCSKPENVHIHETHSTSFLMPSADLWFVDADHTWPAVLDVLNALASGARCIAMHDTNAHAAGFALCEGVSLAAQAIRHHTERFYLEDVKRRICEDTHRGFLLSFDSLQFTWSKEILSRVSSILDGS